jgi:hypothetical protein
VNPLRALEPSPDKDSIVNLYNVGAGIILQAFHKTQVIFVKGERRFGVRGVVKKAGAGFVIRNEFPLHGMEDRYFPGNVPKRQIDGLVPVGA